MANADSTNQRIFEYTLGGRIYIQKSLVLGQLEQVAKSLSGLPLNLFNLESLKQDTEGETLKGTLVKLFNEGLLVKAMACVLIPKGKSVRDRNLDEIEEDLRFECDMEQGAQIIADFFDCNAPSNLISIWKASTIGGMMTRVNPKLANRNPDGLTSSLNSVMEAPLNLDTLGGS